eukprot:4522488-Amphidinium_carterae.4
MEKKLSTDNMTLRNGMMTTMRTMTHTSSRQRSRKSRTHYRRRMCSPESKRTTTTTISSRTLFRRNR